MLAPDRDGHPADANRDRIAAEGAKVQRLNGDAFIESEMLQAAGLALVEPCQSTKATGAFVPTAAGRAIVSGWNGAFILASDYH